MPSLTGFIPIIVWLWTKDILERITPFEEGGVKIVSFEKNVTKVNDRFSKFLNCCYGSHPPKIP